MEKADSTLRSSQAVPHPSTNRALSRLTSEVERDPVHSRWYGRQRIKDFNVTVGQNICASYATAEFAKGFIGSGQGWQVICLGFARVS